MSEPPVRAVVGDESAVVVVPESGQAPPRAVIGTGKPVVAQVGGTPAPMALVLSSGGAAVAQVGGSGGTDLTAVHWRGTWASGALYSLNDLITYGDRLWICTTPSNAGAFDAVAFTEVGAIHTDSGTLRAADPVVQADLVTLRYFESHSGGAGGQIAYRHTQTTPSDQWVIAHGLSFFPNVTVVDSTGREVIGDVSYPDADTVVLTFSAGFGGEAFLS